MQSHRDSRLDALRGLAALLVAVYHIGVAASMPFLITNAHLFDLGYIGTTVFFLISGSVIPPALARSGLRRFWMRRALRLYPLYLVVVLLAYAALPLIMLANLTMVPSWFGVERLLAPVWTLEYEMAFYVLISVAFAFNLPVIPLTISLLLVSPLAPALLPLALICAGMALHTKRAPALIIVVALAAIVGVGDGPRMFGRLVGLAVFVLAMRRAWASPRALTWLGDRSYGVYLIHYPLIGVLPVLAVLPATLVLSALSYALIEQPSVRTSSAASWTRRRSASPDSRHSRKYRPDRP